MAAFTPPEGGACYTTKNRKLASPDILATFLPKPITLGLGALCVVLAAAAAGCFNANVQAPRTIGSEPAAQTPPPPDGRSASQLVAGNNELRGRLARLEKSNQDWASSLQQKKDQLRSLEKQRDEAKKERDRYKKALKD